jgi:thioredoxin-related protein
MRKQKIVLIIGAIMVCGVALTAAVTKSGLLNSTSETASTLKNSTSVSKAQAVALLAEKVPYKVESGKTKLFIVEQHGCSSCVALKADMKTKTIKATLDKDYDIQMVDASELDKLPKTVTKTLGTPTLYFMANDGTELLKISGLPTQDQLKEALAKVTAVNKSNS